MAQIDVPAIGCATVPVAMLNLLLRFIGGWQTNVQTAWHQRQIASKDALSQENEIFLHISSIFWLKKYFFFYLCTYVFSDLY